jgi:hypothetical protein
VKGQSEEPVSEPDGKLGPVEKEARTCPVCGTKFFATLASALRSEARHPNTLLEKPRTTLISC